LLNILGSFPKTLKIYPQIKKVDYLLNGEDVNRRPVQKWVAISNGDFISGPPRPLVAETTSGLFLEHQEILDNSSTMRDGRGTTEEHKQQTGIRPLNGNTAYA
jgi:hypothetical protein